MIRFLCDHCGVPFDAPLRIRRLESLGEFARAYTEELCPVCGSCSFIEADLCPVCCAAKPADELLCAPCRGRLRDRFTAFADELTAEEEQQLDRWLEYSGSVTARTDWL